jgi:hypothetical protein
MYILLTGFEFERIELIDEFWPGLFLMIRSKLVNSVFDDNRLKKLL